MIRSAWWRFDAALRKIANHKPVLNEAHKDGETGAPVSGAKQTKETR
jgi:hypothetical protein